MNVEQSGTIHCRSKRLRRKGTVQVGLLGLVRISVGVGSKGNWRGEGSNPLLNGPLPTDDWKSYPRPSRTGRLVRTSERHG